jgi:hypothetical protein
MVRLTVCLFLLCALLCSQLRAQQMAASPIPRDALRVRMESVARALQWPPLGTNRSDSGVEEVRLWGGSGMEWPSMVFRLRRMRGQTKLEQAFWWAQGPHAESIRRNFQEGSPGSCQQLIRSTDIEVCPRSPPTESSDWNTLWTTRAAQRVRSMVLEQPTDTQREQNDSVASAVEWYDGSRVRRLLPSFSDSSSTGALACLLGILAQRDPDLGLSTSPQDFGC